MICREARESMAAYLDLEVEESERASMVRHFSECAECRKELEALRRTGGLMAGYQAPGAPKGFTERVIQAANPAAPASLWRRSLWKQAIAAAVVVGAGAVLFIAMKQKPSTSEVIVKDAPSVVPPKTMPERKAEEIKVAEVPKAPAEDSVDPQLLENFEILENWELLNDPTIVTALSLPDEDLEALLSATEEGI